VYAHAPDLGGMRTPRPDSPNRALPEGGFRGYADYMVTPEFERALGGLVESAGAGRTCVMCAEADPGHCHRSILADALVARGVRIVHILCDGSTTDHSPRPEAVIEGGRVRYPGPPDLFDPAG
jgi:uncharacterized protein (DUF488 family)